MNINSMVINKIIPIILLSRTVSIAIFIILTLGYIPVGSFAQKPEEPRSGKLTIYQPAEVDTLLSRVYFSNTPKSALKGFRVQIYSGSNRIDANKIKADFLETYFGEKIYFDYKQPYYKVRIGDYRTKAEAQKMYQMLLLDPRFNGVLIVPDEINFPELKIEKPADEQIKGEDK
jgi:hypothetical protein